MTSYFQCEHGVLWQGDCLEIMPMLDEQGVKVDMVLTDPPYGTTQCKWDSVIPFDKMWTCLKYLTFDNTSICLFGSEPFSSLLRCSNLKEYKYDWVWVKPQGVDPLLSKKRPLNNIENISIFYNKHPEYNPQFEEGKAYSVTRDKKSRVCEINGHEFKETSTENDGFRYPKRTLNFSRNTGLHPTQKPVALMEYLIKTYTNEGDTILDFTIGSGTTAVAAINTNRKFIGIEKEEKYCEVATKRIVEALKIEDF